MYFSYDTSQFSFINDEIRWRPGFCDLYLGRVRDHRNYTCYETAIQNNWFVRFSHYTPIDEYFKFLSKLGDDNNVAIELSESIFQ